MAQTGDPSAARRVLLLGVGWVWGIQPVKGLGFLGYWGLGYLGFRVLDLQSQSGV